MARIPDKAEMQRRFAALDIKDRRRIIRAVNRGLVVDDRKLAIPAVGVARRQQRFWKWAWLLGPFVGAFQAVFPEVTIQAAALNSVVATGLMLLLSWYWFTRARRSEQANLALLGIDRNGARSGSRRTSSDDETSSAGERFRSHLPGRGGGQADDRTRPGGATDGPAQGTPDRSPPPGQRPYKPRGRKRRDRG